MLEKYESTWDCSIGNNIFQILKENWFRKFQVSLNSFYVSIEISRRNGLFESNKWNYLFGSSVKALNFKTAYVHFALFWTN